MILEFCHLGILTSPSLSGHPDDYTRLSLVVVSYGESLLTVHSSSTYHSGAIKAGVESYGEPLLRVSRTTNLQMSYGRALLRLHPDIPAAETELSAKMTA